MSWKGSLVGATWVVLVALGASGTPSSYESGEREWIQRVEQAVDAADFIATCRLLESHAVEQVAPAMRKQHWPSDSVRVFKLEVVKGLMGGVVGESVLIVLPLETDADVSSPEVGEVALCFLKVDDTIRAKASDGTMSALRRIAGEAVLYKPGPLGIVWAEASDDAKPTYRLIGSFGGDREAVVPVDEFVRAVASRVESTTPSLRANFVTNGPHPWSVHVQPNGRWQESTTGELTLLEGSKLWWSAARAFSPDLPETVGEWLHPDQASRMLEFRTVEGVRRVRVFERSDRDKSSAEHWRGPLDDLWMRLPGAAKPIAGNWR